MLLNATAPPDTPSDWVQRWSHLVPAAGTVLDVACGNGRHLRWFYERNHAVSGVDVRLDAIEIAARYGEAVQADLETGPWPFAARRFDCVVVTHYLWRPLLPTLVASVAPGGVLVYETFATGNAAYGKPARPDFLLQPGELLRACTDLRVVAYEDGFLAHPTPRCVQRIVAVRPVPGEAIAALPLQPGSPAAPP